MPSRRSALIAPFALALAVRAGAVTPMPERWHGLIGTLRAKPGQRDALIALLLEGSAGMPGCLSYVVAQDGKDADLIWVTEVWATREAHAASLKLPAVRAAIAKAMPLFAGFETVAETVPIGGIGLATG